VPHISNLEIEWYKCRGREGNPTRAERYGLEKGQREKGISVCMALKLISCDETASVIKTGYVRDVVFHSDEYMCVCVCV